MNTARFISCTLLAFLIAFSIVASQPVSNNESNSTTHETVITQQSTRRRIRIHPLNRNLDQEDCSRFCRKKLSTKKYAIKCKGGRIFRNRCKVCRKVHMCAWGNKFF